MGQSDERSRGLKRAILHSDCPEVPEIPHGLPLQDYMLGCARRPVLYSRQSGMELEDSETIACLVSLTALAMQQPQPICTCVACLFDSEPSAPPSHSFDPSSIPIVYMGAHPPSLFLLNSIQIPFSMFSMCQHDEWGARECDITESE